MEKLFAIGDIHGEHELLLKLMDMIEAKREGDEGFTMVFLGDYVDRGPDSRDVVEFLMRGPSNPKDNWICLKGNHEDMMVRALVTREVDAWRHWEMNGGNATIKSWENPDDPGYFTVTPEQGQWLAGLPVMLETPNHVFVHAGLMPGVDLDHQEEEVCMWIRDRFLRDNGSTWNKHVVHGHTPQHGLKPKISQPELLPWRTNLDTGAYHTQILTAGMFDWNINSGPITIIQAEGFY